MVKRTPINAIGENSRRTSFTATKFRPQIITVASIIRSVVPQARAREGGEVDVTGGLSWVMREMRGDVGADAAA